ncbi:hypothetical protein RND81_10G104300 [Saponaria officinalis]|uniref:Uncharacterized protein n=1 Tax=Saponaria officinalis TaxID=3572 RepID=A0AAW1I0R2_SAPOF
MDFRRSNCVVVDDESKIREKHQGVLQEYLVLQKECVLKKRKLKEAKERKTILLDEISFLKHRRNLLLKKQLQKSEQQHEITQSLNTDSKNVESSRRYMNGSVGASTSTSGQAFKNHRPPVIPMRNSVNGGKEVAAFAPLYPGKKTKNSVSNGKRAYKRKISWQDPLALKV